MSVLRAQGDRGPVENHLLDRFSTTYSTSYRPYEETRRSVPIQCVTSSKSGNVADNATNLSRGARFWPINTEPTGSRSTNAQLRSGDVTYTSTSHQPSISRVLNPLHRMKSENSVGVGISSRRSWDDTALISNTAIGIDRPRPRPPGMSVPGTASYRTAQNVGVADLSNGSIPSSTTGVGNKDTRTYTSSYTTVVSDKLNPCFAISNDAAPTKSSTTTQTEKPTPTFCASVSRTATTSNASLSASRPDHSISDLGVSKLSLGPASNPASATGVAGSFVVSTSPNLASTSRPLNLSSVSPYQSVAHFDFGQMFSQIARINNHLYLSSLNALTPDRLKQHGITLLVSAMIDPPPTQLRNSVSNSMHVAVEDIEGANLRAHFDRVADRIAAEHRRGGRTLVHCMAGVSRSSSLILAYLMRHMNMSLAEAYQHVRGIRPCIQPNPGFWRQLLDYEERLRGTRSVRLLPPLGYSSTCSVSPTGGNRLFYTSTRHTPRSTYLDMFARNTGDLLPYRPLTTLHSIDSSKPYIGCRQPLG